MKIPENQQLFKYLAEARRFAFEQPGSELIRTDGSHYYVETVDESHWSPAAVDAWADQKGRFLAGLMSPKSKELETAKLAIESVAKAQGRFKAVEFIFDQKKDGAQNPDDRFVFNETGEIKPTSYPLTKGSKLLESDEEFALEVVREAMADAREEHLLSLNPKQIDILLNSDALSPQERTYVQEKLNSPEFKNMLSWFEQFFSENHALRTAGTDTLEKLVRYLNQDQHQKNVGIILDIAKHPEGFRNSLGQDHDRLEELGQTLKLMPGFRHYPQGLKDDKTKKRVYEDAIRVIELYKYKMRVETGMSFTKEGLASHGSKLSYRFGGAMVSLGLSGRDFDFTQGIPQVGFENRVGSARQRISAEFTSGVFDIKTSVARDDQGKLKFETPESDFANRYIARQGDQALDKTKAWAKENPFWAGAIVAGALGGAYAFSKIKPDTEIPLEFGSSFSIYDNEFTRVKGSVTPKITLKDGKVDLGVEELGLGVSGNKQHHYYDLNVKHRFEDTTIRAWDVQGENLEVNLRYGYKRHAIMLDTQYNYQDFNLRNRVGYRKEFLFQPGFSGYAHGYVQFAQGDQYETAGVVVGAQKYWGELKSFSAGVHVGYDQLTGMRGGFNLIKEF